MKILIYIGSLKSGGAEKVVSHMANYWAHTHEIVLLTDVSEKEDFFEIHSKVKRISTGFLVSKKNIFIKYFSHLKGLLQLRKIIKDTKPEIIISHLPVANVRMLLSTFNLKIPLIVEDHNNPAFNKIPQPWRILRPIMYMFTNKVVLLTEDLKKHYHKGLQSKIVIIPNPLNIPRNIINSNEVILKHPTFISTGNFRYIKGYDLLIQAFSHVVKVYPDWYLTLLGDGKERKNLSLLAEKLGVSDKIDMPGRVNNPYTLLKQAEIYVLSSRSEGFPVALCEAMGVGMPCISFDCPTGPSDIINNNHNGLLIEYLNVEKLAEAMIKLVENSNLRERLSKEALKINNDLEISVIMKKWETIITQSMGK